MKTQDEIIKEQFGISLDAIDTTPMDKGECKICMTAWAEQQVNKLNLLDVSNRRELLFAFIKEWKEEFKDENWDYLDFMAERFLGKQ
jgi:hypothetical protein